jgi:hypothetical protein
MLDDLHRTTNPALSLTLIPNESMALSAENAGPVHLQ